MINGSAVQEGFIKKGPKKTLIN